MNRRQILTQIGVGAVVGIAGCAGGANTPGTADERNDPEQESTSSTTLTDASNPGVPAIADQSCPPYGSSRDRAVCSQTVETDSEPVFLDPTPNQSALDSGAPVKEITLALHNRSSRELTFNPHSWSIWYNPSAEWMELDQQHSGDGKVTLSPDDVHSWSFTEAVESVQEDLAFEPGLYAAEIGVPDPEQSNAWVACIALLKLGAEE